MRYGEILWVAFRGLRANVLRSLLTMLGVVIGVAAVITMLAVGAGAQSLIAEHIRKLGANLLMVMPGAAKEAGARLASGTRHTLTEQDAVAIRDELQSVSLVAPAVYGPAQVIYGNRNWSTNVYGVGPEYFIVREWDIETGRGFTDSEMRTAGKSVLLGSTVAQALFENRDPIGEIVRISKVPFTVVGVLREKGAAFGGTDIDDIIFVPLPTAKLRLIGGKHSLNRDSLGYIMLKLPGPKNMGGAMEEVRRLLRQRHRLPAGAEDDFRIRDPADIMRAQQESRKTFTLFMAAIASISLIVGGISIMNIMLVSVTERTREIGVRLAIGARGADIRNQFLIESVILCVLGGAIGVIVGVVAAYLLAAAADWVILIEPASIILSVGFAAAVGVFFGYYPAFRASRLDPIEALRYE